MGFLEIGNGVGNRNIRDIRISWNESFYADEREQFEKGIPFITSEIPILENISFLRSFLP